MGKWLTPDSPAAGFICRTLRIPNSEECLAIVNGALADLAYARSFEEYGDLSPGDTAALFAEMYEDYISFRGCMIGTIFAHANSTAPVGSLACDGASYERVDYPNLYSVLASAFITDDDNFTVPDLRGRTLLGVGTGTGLTARSINQSGGEEAHSLSSGEMPTHAHAINGTAILYTPGAAPAAGLAVTPPIAATNNSGGGGSHNNMQPWLAANYAIWAQ